MWKPTIIIKAMLYINTDQGNTCTEAKMYSFEAFFNETR